MKATPHALVDGLPQEMWAEAERYLTGLTTDDPVLRKFLLAPPDDEPETEEGRLAVEEARGETFSLEEVKAHLSLPG